MKNHPAGQSTIEFLMSMVFSLGVLFMFIQLALNTTSGYLAHYATYMASRAYMVYEANSNQPEGSDGPAGTYGTTVLKSFSLDKFGIPGVYKTPLSFNDPGQVANSNMKFEYVGAKLSFELPFPLVRFYGKAPNLELTSESFIGREPSRADCLQRICFAMANAYKKTLNCASEVLHVTLFDDGC